MADDKVMQIILDASTKKANHNLKEFKGTIGETKEVIKKTRLEMIQSIEFLNKSTKLLLKATENSTRYTTSLRTLKTVLGDTSKIATNYVDNLSKMTGLDEATLTDQMVKFSQLGKSISLSDKYAEKFAEDLSTLTTKLALLYDTDYSVMASNVQKAIQGTQTTLKATTGIEANTLSEQALLMSYGIDRQVSSLNEAEKSIVRYASILQQVTSRNQVYQDSVNSLAWQKQMLTAQIRRLATVIGGALTPAFTNLYTIANAVLIVITEIIKVIAQLVGGTVRDTSDIEQVSDTFDELGNSVGGASATIKKSLRSFDKLNNITTPSGGGGGVASALGIDKNILGLLDKMQDNLLNIRTRASEIADDIMKWLGFSKDTNGQWKWSSTTLLKNIWNWWKKLNVLAKVFVGIGVALAISKIVAGFTALLKVLIVKPLTSVVSLFTDMFKVTKDGHSYLQSTASAMERVQAGLIGIASMTMGLLGIVSAVQKIKEEGLNFNNVLELIIGTLALVGGAIATVTAITGGFEMTMALATGGITLLLGAVAGLITWFATQTEETKKTTSATEEYKNKIAELDKEIENNLKQTEAKVGRSKELEKRLLELVDANGKVIGSEEEASNVIASLNDLLGTEYEITGNQISLNGKSINSYNELKNSIDKYCSSLRTEAMLQQYREKYNATLERQRIVTEEIDRATQRLNDSAKNYNLETEEGTQRWLKDNRYVIDSLSNLYGEYDTLDKSLTNYEEASYLASVGRYEEAQKLLKSTVEDVSHTYKDTVENVINQTNRIPDEVKKKVTEVNNYQPTLTMNLKVNTKGAYQTVTDFFNQTTQKQLNLTAKADGGFLNEGEIFVAREAGPEMVGTINGHSAVANNDQIVSGIQSGVFNAMMSALSNVNFGGDTVIEANADTQGLLDFITFKQKQRERQFN